MRKFFLTILAALSLAGCQQSQADSYMIRQIMITDACKTDMHISNIRVISETRSFIRYSFTANSIYDGEARVAKSITGFGNECYIYKQN